MTAADTVANFFGRIYPEIRSALLAALGGAEEIVFSNGDDSEAVTTASGSGRYYPQRKETLAFVAATLADDGSSTTTVSIRKNGVQITTISLASGDFYEAVAPATAFVPGTDYLTVQATAAGTGAKGLTVQARFE